MPPADRTAWERLGRLLAERRVQISPRYANRRAFAADREMNWRTLHDVEAAKRVNFRPQTMRAFETAYMLVPGSLDRTLAGGAIEPAAAASQPPLRQVPETPPAPPGLTPEEVLAGLLRQYEDDDHIQTMAVLGARRGASARVVVEEIWDWIDFLKGLSRRAGTGSSAGLREDDRNE